MILFSPSGQANIGISKNKIFLQHREKYTSNTPVNEFKIATYREAFKNHIGKS